MLYNTKLVPLFRITSKTRKRNMLYNIFLDLGQLIRSYNKEMMRKRAVVAEVGQTVRDKKAGCSKNILLCLYI